jgi:hypothetical protein
MRKLRLVLILACVAAGAFFAVRYVWRSAQRAQGEEQCQGVAHSLAARLIKEPAQNFSEARLQDVLREPGVIGREGQVALDGTGAPVDVWGTPFRPRIVDDQDGRWVEVRSAGPDGRFGTEDDCSAREKL